MEISKRDAITQKLKTASEFVSQYYPDGRGKLIFPNLVENWLRAESLEAGIIAAKELKQLVRSGMGSFTDVVLIPNQNSQLGFDELNDQFLAIMSSLWEMLNDYIGAN